MQVDNNTFINIGIDSLGFYAPKTFLKLDDLAQARQIDPLKLRTGLLLKEMRIPECGEDIISLGLKAAYNAITRGNINSKEIDGLFVGTETTIYAVKSVSNIFVDLLDLAPNCMTQDISNACAAGTLAILNAISMIQSGILSKVLVIAADISSYELGSPGEPTQGAGAVAIILTKNPRIAQFSKSMGMISSNINDFFRPAGEKNAQVFGKYSVQSYMSLQMAAFNDLQLKNSLPIDYHIFHGPYARLPLKFMQSLAESNWLDNIETLMQIYPEITVPRIDDFKLDESLLQMPLITESMVKKLNGMNFSIEKKAQITSWIENRIKFHFLPALHVPMYFGNMYSASVWAQLTYLIENSGHVNDIIYFGSYGSGATCLSGLLKIMPEFEQVISKGPFLTDILTNKTQISFIEYENLRKCTSTINYYEFQKWGKIDPLSFMKESGLLLTYCDHGCILPKLDPLGYCPKGHHGGKNIFFPMVGKFKGSVKSTLKNDMTPLYEGYFPLMEDPKPNQILELEFRKIRSLDDEMSEAKGLLNWIPSYRSTDNSPYCPTIDKK